MSLEQQVHELSHQVVTVSTQQPKAHHRKTFMVHLNEH